MDEIRWVQRPQSCAGNAATANQLHCGFVTATQDAIGRTFRSLDQPLPCSRPHTYNLHVPFRRSATVSSFRRESGYGAGHGNADNQKIMGVMNMTLEATKSARMSITFAADQVSTRAISAAAIL